MIGVMAGDRKRSTGFSLVELMVALVISLLIGIAVLQVFLSSKNTYRLQETMGQLQENGRFAVNYLANDLRMSGFMGCGNVDRIPVNIIAKADGGGLAVSAFDGDAIIVGQNDVAASNTWGAVAGTDTLVMRKAASGSMRLTGNMSAVNANIQVVSNSLGAVAGDILFISDCINADIFRATGVSSSAGTVTIAHANNINTSNNLSKAYGPDAEVLMFESVAYYVRNTGRTTPNGDAIRALYVQRKAGGTAETATAYELIEGVEDMQLEFGVDSGDDNLADSYQPASGSVDWGKVVSVRFSLLMQAVDGKLAGGGGQAINYNGSAVTADGRLRQKFGTVVAVRNRVP